MMDVMAGRNTDNSNKGRSKEEYEETGAFPTLSRPTTAPPPSTSQSQSQSQSRNSAMNNANNGSRTHTHTHTHNDAARIAAEELAAARVEVMMQRLSAENLEDDEAEI
jgi:hypothetical protein